MELNLDSFADPSDLIQVAATLDALALYARTKGRAMRYRSYGDIEDALKEEAKCDRIHGGLPPWAKW